MRFRGPLIGLTVFMTVALTLGWLVYATLLREVSGSTTAYSAIFTDVYGLREGDDVRMAGVRVGRAPVGPSPTEPGVIEPVPPAPGPGR